MLSPQMQKCVQRKQNNRGQARNRTNGEVQMEWQQRGGGLAAGSEVRGPWWRRECSARSAGGIYGKVHRKRYREPSVHVEL